MLIRKREWKMTRSKILSYLIILSIFILTLTACNKQDISQKNIKKDEQISDTSENSKELSALEFSLKDQYGNSHSLSKYKGKTVLLIFWAKWYPTYLIDKDGKISKCIKEIMHYDDMKKSIENSFN